MYRLYLDTCILNDAFPLFRREWGETVEAGDVKVPVSRWAEEYVALYHLLDLDDQWELEFGTSQVTLQEIDRFRTRSSHLQDKKSFLEDIAGLLYEQFREKCRIESGTISPILFQRVKDLLGPTDDVRHICQAIQGGYDYFITTDFRTILNHQSELDEVVVKVQGHQAKLWPHGGWEPIVEKLGIKVRSPLQFIEEKFMVLPVLIRTLYGSWTDPDEFIRQTAQALLQLATRQ
jgi:hypothetical protein